MLRSAGAIYAARPALCTRLTAVAVLLLDFVTGKQIQFPVLFILPTAMAAWQNRRIEGYLLAVALPAARVGFHIPWHETGALGISLVNGLIRATVLCVCVYLVDRVATQSRMLQRRVRMLEGVLPICAWCKRIRNEESRYEAIEQYITTRSEASFSHGICPECSRKLDAGSRPDDSSA